MERSRSRKWTVLGAISGRMAESRFYRTDSAYNKKPGFVKSWELGWSRWCIGCASKVLPPLSSLLSQYL